MAAGIASGMLGDSRTTLRRVRPSALDDDPFWSVVRQRHPDATVVVLPRPDAPPTAGGPPALSHDEVREVALLVGQTWASLAPRVRRVATVPADRAASSPAVSWRGRGSEDTQALVLVKGLPGIGLDPGIALLRDIGVALLEAGWAVDAHQGPRGESVLSARGGRVDLEAVAGPGATVVRVASGLLRTTPEVRDRVREEVRSWV